MLDVGLRSSYVASYYAAPLMVSRRHGLIVFTSASGSVHYVYGPVYGAHKAGMDKFAADMAVDLKDFDVAAVSIWMGALKTERLQRLIDSAPEKYAHLAGMYRNAGVHRPCDLERFTTIRAAGDQRPDGDRRGNGPEVRHQGRRRPPTGFLSRDPQVEPRKHTLTSSASPHPNSPHRSRP